MTSGRRSGEPAVRDVSRLQVTRVGAVERDEDASLSYRILDAQGRELAEVSDFLRHLTASDVSPASVGSYARALLRWLRFLWAVGVAWDRAGQVEVRDFVLWLRSARKQGPTRRPEGPTPGSVNPKTGKRYLTTGFAPATINHNLAVVSAWYDHAIDYGRGPVRNPVPARAGPDGGRHTCAVRLANDPTLPLTDVQTLLGHAWITTTQRYLAPLAEEVWAHARHTTSGDSNRRPRPRSRPRRRSATTTTTCGSCSAPRSTRDGHRPGRHPTGRHPATGHITGHLRSRAGGADG